MTRGLFLCGLGERIVRFGGNSVVKAVGYVSLQNELREPCTQPCALKSRAARERPGVWLPAPDPAWKYLFASDEQGRDPEQLEAVCSHRRGDKEAVQSVHRQAQRLEGEAELAVHGD